MQIEDNYVSLSLRFVELDCPSAEMENLPISI